MKVISSLNKSRLQRGRSIKGFTLVEIAIVLVIIGMLIGLGSGMIGPLTKRAKYNETKDLINGAVESVISFAAANNRIATTTEFTSIVRRPRDAWTKDLYYIPATNLDDLNSGGVCGRKTTGIIVQDCTNPGCTTFNTIRNVAFAVISGAENYNVQTNFDNTGTVIVYEMDTPNIDNCTDANNCPSAATANQDPDRVENFDDIIKWITLDELRIKTGCTGPQLRILNNDLPSGFLNSAYSAVVSADGGVRYAGGGNYRWCRQESVSTGLTFTPPTLSLDCLGLTEGNWVQADNITISGTAVLFGNTTFTFFVRDDNDPGTNDNIAQKSFSLTISPPSWVSVRNTTGASRYYRVNGLTPCQTIANNTNFSAGFTETITFFTTAARCNTNTISCSQYFSPLSQADTNRNGIVRLSAIAAGSCTITDD